MFSEHNGTTPNMTGSVSSSRKILMVGWDIDEGGAASATRNIFKALRNYTSASDLEFEIQLRTVKGSAQIGDGHEIGPSRVGRISYFSQKYRWLLRRGLRHVIYGEPSFLLTTADIDTGMGREIVERKPDLVHLFWLGNRTISIREIGKLQKAGIPVVWTLSDCWPIAGVHHYPRLVPQRDLPTPCDSEAKKQRRKEHRWDTKIFRAKARNWSEPISLVVKSSWLQEQAKTSSLSRSWPTVLIPNPIDVQFQGKRTEVRNAQEKVILGFGFLGRAAERKGAQVVESALARIIDSVEENSAGITFELLLFGDATFPTDLAERYQVFVRQEGRVPRQRMAEIYSRLDILLAPSLQDNSPNLVSEAIAHGVPAVAFRGTGLDDVVIDGVTGLTVEGGNIVAFSGAIRRLILDPKLRSSLSDSSAKFAMQNWAPQVVAEKYIDLYRTVLARDG